MRRICLNKGQIIQLELDLELDMYIAQIKRKCGFEVDQNYKQSKSERSKVQKCSPEKNASFWDALKHFK